jgi:hypothetical protein
MDNEWQQWLSWQRDSHNLDADHILKDGLFYNALHSSGIDYTFSPQPMVTHWNGLDSEEAYARHGGDPDKRALLAAHGWLDTTIDYEINSWGFRSKGCAEFDTITEPSLITMGCSFTFGTGLPQTDIWPQLAADDLGLELINLATAGHGLSMNTQWLLTQGHTLKDPRAVVIYMPPPGRMSWYQVVPGNPPIPDHIVGNTFSMSQWDRNLNIHANLRYNAHMDYVKNYSTIKLWCDHRRIPLHFFMGAEGDPATYGLARDLAHHGRGWHRAMAKGVVQRVKNLRVLRAKSS